MRSFLIHKSGMELCGHIGYNRPQSGMALIASRCGRPLCATAVRVRLRECKRKIGIKKLRNCVPQTYASAAAKRPGGRRAHLTVVLFHISDEKSTRRTGGLASAGIPMHNHLCRFVLKSARYCCIMVLFLIEIKTGSARSFLPSPTEYIIISDGKKEVEP